jgi:hypothetical protein
MEERAKLISSQMIIHLMMIVVLVLVLVLVLVVYGSTALAQSDMLVICASRTRNPLWALWNVATASPVSMELYALKQGNLRSPDLEAQTIFVIVGLLMMGKIVSLQVDFVCSKARQGVLPKLTTPTFLSFVSMVVAA